MDSQKKSLILCWVSNVWGKKAETFLELKDGQFFHQVLELLEYATQDSEVKLKKQSEDVKKYFEEHYGKEACIDKLLKFDVLVEEPARQEHGLDVELELAKITIFLLSLALFSTKSKQIVATASLDLPVHMHGDVKTIVQAVVETQFTESSCSSNIEEILRSPSGLEKSFDESSMKAFFEMPFCHSLTLKEQRLLREMSPIEVVVNDISASVNEIRPKTEVSQDLFVSRDSSSSPPARKEFSVTDHPMKSTPKYSKNPVPAFNVSKMFPVDSPLPPKVSTHNVSFGISSPFRALNISASSSVSPLANFIQSPEIIQKVLLKKKELELSKMKRELNNQIYLCEDLQITIQENVEQISSKDVEIDKLKARVKELLTLQDARDELEEIRPKLADLEATIEKLNCKLLKLEYYKSQCQILEKENSDQRNDIQQLHEEIQSLELEMGEKKVLLLAKNQMDIQIKTLEAQVTELSKGKAELGEECSVLNGKLDHMTLQNDQLQKEMDEFMAKNNESTQGESMGIIVELQLGELKAQVEELTQIRSDLEEQLDALKESQCDKEREVTEVNEHLADKEKIMTSLENTIKITEEQLICIKSEISSKEFDNDQLKTAVSDLSRKLEEERSVVTEQRTSHEALMLKTLQELSEVAMKSKEYENQTMTLSNDLKEAKFSLQSQQERNEEIVLELNCKESEIISFKTLNETLQRENEDKKQEVILLSTEREGMIKKLADMEDILSVCEQSSEDKGQELKNVEKLLNDMKQVVAEKEKSISTLESNLAVKESVEDKLNTKVTLYEGEISRLQNSMYEKEISTKNSMLELKTEMGDLMSKQEIEIGRLISRHEAEIDVLISKQDTEIGKLVSNHHEAIVAMEEQLESLADEKVVISQSLELKCVELEEMSQRLKSKESSVSLLEEEKGKINIALNVLQNRITSMEEKLTIAKQQLEDRNSENNLVKEQLSQKENDLKLMSNEKEEQCLAVAELQSKLESLENEKMCFSLKVDKQCEEIETMKNLIDETAGRQEEHMKEIEKKKEDVSTLQLLFKQKSQEVEELCSERDCALSEIKKLESQFQGAQTQISHLNSDLATKALQVCSLEKERENAYSEISSLHTQINLLTSKEKDASENHEKLVCCLRADVQDQAAEISSLKVQLEENCQNTEQQLAEYNMEMENCNMKIKDLDNQLSVLKSQVGEYEEEIAVQKSEKDNLSATIKETLKMLEKEKSNLTEVIEAKNLEFEDLNDRFQENIIAQSETQEKNIQLNAIVSKLEGKVKEFEENHSSMTFQLTGKESEISVLKETIKNKDVQLQQVVQNLSDDERNIAELRANLKTLEKEHDDVKCSLENTLSDVSTMQNILQETEYKNKELEKEIKSRLSDNETLAGNYEDKSEELNQLRLDMETLNDGLESQLTACKTQIATLNSNIGNKDGEIKLLNKECENKSTQLAEAQTKVDNLMLSSSQDQKIMETKLTEYSQQVSNILAQVQQKDEQISGKDEEISDLTLKAYEQSKTKDEEILKLQEECENKSTQLTEAQTKVESLMLSSSQDQKIMETKLTDHSQQVSNILAQVQQKEQQILAKDEEISDLTLKAYEQSKTKDEEIQKLQEECNNKSTQLTEAQTKVESLMLSSSQDQKIMETKLTDHSQQVSNILAQVQQKEQQILAKDEEISDLTLKAYEQSKTKDEEIQKLQEECKNKSTQLTEAQTKVESLMLNSSQDQKIMETKLTEHSQQVSNILAQVQQKDQQISAKEEEISDLTQNVNEQSRMIEELSSNIDQAKLSLSEMMSLKGSTEKAKEEILEELAEKQCMLSKLNEEICGQEENRLLLVQALEEESNRLQEQAVVLKDKDQVICQLQIELSARAEVNDKLNLKEQELSSLTAENKSMKERYAQEMNLLREQKDLTMASISKHFRDLLGADDTSDSETMDKGGKEEARHNSWQEAVEQIKIKCQTAKDNHIMEIEQTRKEIQDYWLQKIDKIVEEREEERSEFKMEIEMKQKMVETQDEVEKNMVALIKMEADNYQKRMKDLSAEWKQKMDDLEAKSESELKAEVERLEKEKEELNAGWQNALGDLQVKFEAAKASEMKELSEQKAEVLAVKEDYECRLTTQRREADKLLKAVHEENTKLLERETLHLKNTESQMKTANEYCNSLKKQLETQSTMLKTSEQERLNLKETSDKHNQQLSKMRETNESLNSALHIERDTNVKMQQRMEGHVSKYNNTRMLLEKVQQENKGYAVEINKLKTSLDYSERKLQEYKHQLDQDATTLLGDSSHFQRIIQEHDNSMMSEENTPRYNLRSSIESRHSIFPSPNETIISADTVMLKRETLASTADLMNLKQNDSPKSRLSICSTSSAQSIKSLNGLPAGARPNMQSCANEPEDFEWGRLSELQRRNTLCLPHMKSSYPVETQRVKKDKISDDSVRLSIMPNKKATVEDNMDSKSLRLRKRKSPEVSRQSETISPKQMKSEVSPGGTVVYFPLSKDGPVYPRPSTPGKQRRCAKGSFSSPHSIGKQKVLGSTIARRKQHTPSPRKSPRLNPKSPFVRNKPDHENKLQESISFSIGFTPDKNNGRKRMMKKKEANPNDSKLSAPKRGLTHVRQMVKEVSKRAGLTEPYVWDMKMQESPFNFCETLNVDNCESKTLAVPVTNENPVNLTETYSNKNQKISNIVPVKINLLSYFDEHEASSHSGDFQKEPSVKPNIEEISVSGKEQVDSAGIVLVKPELFRVEKVSNGTQKKLVTFSSDVLEKNSGQSVKTFLPDKEIAKSKGKVAKIVSFFTTAHSVKKDDDNKETKRSSKKAKSKVVPTRLMSLQSPLAYKPAFHEMTPFVHVNLESPVAGSVGRKKTPSHSVFPSSSLGDMLNQCSTPFTPKGKRPKKKLFTPNRITPCPEKTSRLGSPKMRLLQDKSPFVTKHQMDII